MPEPVLVEIPVADINDDEARHYAEIAGGVHSDGALGRIVFCVSTDDLEEGKGDPYVALGLGKYLIRKGWGVSLWPTRRWHETPDPEPTIAIVMLESFIPGLLPQSTTTIAWVRNWTDAWAALPYLEEFDGIWCSSPASADVIRSHYSGRVSFVPIATDLDLFSPDNNARVLPVVTTANYWGVERQLESALAAVAETLPVVWFGANGEHLKRAEVVIHADRVSFFGLGSIYRQAKIVVDDLIEAACAYGSQNSRLFESIACGAVPITNSSIGLDHLGLGEVPSYSDDRPLTEVIGALLDDEGALRDLSERLRRVVVERHSFRIRADEVAPLLGEAIQRSHLRGARPGVLVWAAGERLKLQAAESMRDGHLITVRRLEREQLAERARAQEELAALEQKREVLVAELRSILASRPYRLALRLSLAVARLRHLGTKSR